MRSGKVPKTRLRQSVAPDFQKSLQEGLLVAPKARVVLDTSLPSGVAAGLLHRTCFNLIRVIPRSAFLLLAFLQSFRLKRSLEPCVLPSLEASIIAAAAGFSFSPVIRATQTSMLSRVPDVAMELVPALTALHHILDLNHQGGVTPGGKSSLVLGRQQGSPCPSPVKGAVALRCNHTN